MERTFEDAMMDVLGKMVSVCLEALSIIKKTADNIYIYCNNEGVGTSFYVFFAQDGKIKSTRDIGMPYSLLDQVEEWGWKYIKEINSICAKHKRPAPSDIRIWYSPQTRKFDVKYYYDTDSLESEVLRAWMAEEQKKLAAD